MKRGRPQGRGSERERRGAPGWDPGGTRTAAARTAAQRDMC
jgi:hypothetical protein